MPRQPRSGARIGWLTTAFALWVGGGALIETAASAQRITRATAGKRICEYKSHRFAGRMTDYVAIPRGQPCPTNPPRPAPVQQVVPSLATLSSQGSRRGQTICIYQYGGHSYEMPGGSRLTCPLTPNVF